MNIDLVVRGDRILLAGEPEPRPAALHLRAGRIAAITARDDRLLANAPELSVGRRLVTPGVVDTHVHINEPGRTEWEGFRTATQAAAVGGITTLVDMPLNCIPATTSAAAAALKREHLKDQRFVDIAFWGGVVPGNLAELEGLARFGVPGCKCFLCPSGVDEFPHVDRAVLEEALPKMRELGLTLLVHAESPGPLEIAERLISSNDDPRAYRTYLRSRPAAAEDEAIAMVIELCRKHRARAHIVHLSSASALPLLRAARADGVQVSAETCLHYLAFSAEDIEPGDTRFKCAPPIREAANRELLWGGLLDGTLSMVVSDHSPCTPNLKRLAEGDFMQAWGGISSLQLGLSVLYTLARDRGVSLAQVVQWSSTAPAALAGLAGRKGALQVAADADFVVWDDTASFTVEPERLRHRHQVTPYAGRQLFGVVDRTFVRGKQVYDRAEGVSSTPHGQFLEV